MPLPRNSAASRPWWSLVLLAGLVASGYVAWRATGATRPAPPPNDPVNTASAAPVSTSSPPRADRPVAPPASRVNGGSARANQRDVALPLPPAMTPLADSYDALSRRARAGDVRAACRLAADLQQCASAGQLLAVADGIAGADTFTSFGSKSSATGTPAQFAAQLLKSHDRSRAMCAGMPAEWIDQGFRYQAIAADGGGANLERWLVARPALDPQDFLQDLDAWSDYRKRAQAYVARSLQQRDGGDLGLLLLIHAPGDRIIARPPYRVEDETTFLALHEIARRNGSQIDTAIDQAARELRASLTPAQERSVGQAAARLDGGWSRAATAEPAGRLFAAGASRLCGD